MRLSRSPFMSTATCARRVSRHVKRRLFPFVANKTSAPPIAATVAELHEELLMHLTAGRPRITGMLRTTSRCARKVLGILVVSGRRPIHANGAAIGHRGELHGALHGGCAVSDHGLESVAWSSGNSALRSCTSMLRTNHEDAHRRFLACAAAPHILRRYLCPVVKASSCRRVHVADIGAQPWFCTQPDIHKCAGIPQRAGTPTTIPWAATIVWARRAHGLRRSYGLRRSHGLRRTHSLRLRQSDGLR